MITEYEKYLEAKSQREKQVAFDANKKAVLKLDNSGKELTKKANIESSDIKASTAIDGKKQKVIDLYSGNNGGALFKNVDDVITTGKSKLSQVDSTLAKELGDINFNKTIVNNDYNAKLKDIDKLMAQARAKLLYDQAKVKLKK